MKNSFNNRFGPWALVTGASSGIGAALSEQLAQKGLNVAMVARRGDRLETSARLFREKYGVQAKPIPLDLLAHNALNTLEEQVAELDLGLIAANAGFGYAGLHEQADENVLSRMVRLNCEIPALMARRFAPRLIERGKGGVLITASVASFMPTPYMACYGATKAFDLMLAESLFAEFKGTGVTCLALCPGPTKTEFGQVSKVKGSYSKGPDPHPVAAKALAKLGKTPSTIHSVFLPRLAVFLGRFMPRSVLLWSSAVNLAKGLLNKSHGKVRE